MCETWPPTRKSLSKWILFFKMNSKFFQNMFAVANNLQKTKLSSWSTFSRSSLAIGKHLFHEYYIYIFLCLSWWSWQQCSRFVWLTAAAISCHCHPHMPIEIIRSYCGGEHASVTPVTCCSSKWQTAVNPHKTPKTKVTQHWYSLCWW